VVASGRPATRPAGGPRPFIVDQRERLVLKPNDAYGGAGIVLGWEVDGPRGSRRVRVALTEPFVVQERVPIPSEPFPSVVDGRMVLATAF